jgi:hypothetical protein
LEAAGLRMFLENRLNAIQVDHLLISRPKGGLQMEDHELRAKELQKRRRAFCYF